MLYKKAIIIVFIIIAFTAIIISYNNGEKKKIETAIEKISNINMYDIENIFEKYEVKILEEKDIAKNENNINIKIKKIILSDNNMLEIIKVEEINRTYGSIEFSFNNYNEEKNLEEQYGYFLEIANYFKKDNKLFNSKYNEKMNQVIFKREENGYRGNEIEYIPFDFWEEKGISISANSSYSDFTYTIDYYFIMF